MILAINLDDMESLSLGVVAWPWEGPAGANHQRMGW